MLIKLCLVGNWSKSNQALHPRSERNVSPSLFVEISIDLTNLAEVLVSIDEFAFEYMLENWGSISKRSMSRMAYIVDVGFSMRQDI